MFDLFCIENHYSNQFQLNNIIQINMKTYTIFIALLLAVSFSDAKFLKKWKKWKHPKIFPQLSIGLTAQKEVVESVRDVEVIHEKAVIQEIIKEVPVNVFREEPFERLIHVERPVEVIRKIPIERVQYIDRPVEVIREVPVEHIVRKIVEVPREIQIPVPVEVSSFKIS